MTQTTYALKPYKTVARKECDPNRLGAIAQLYGLETAPPSSCRVAELGCGSGGNLIPLAERYPQSFFIGIDSAETHVADARGRSEALKLTNIEWICADIRSYNLDPASFDYILAHGLYSWVADDVRARILHLCKRSLSPHGVALVSYNTLPGWRQRGAARDIMQVGARMAGGLDPDEQLKAAVRMLQIVSSSRPEHGDLYGSYLREMLARFGGSESSYLFHEFLEEHNDPCLFSDFMKRASAEGLQFVAEAKVSLMSSDDLNGDVQALLAEQGSDIIAREQILDLCRNRMFRETILCDGRHVLKRDLKASVFKRVFFRTTFRKIATPTGEPRFLELVSGREIAAPEGIVSDVLATVGRFGAPGARSEDVREHTSVAGGTISEADLVSSLVTLWRSGFIEIALDGDCGTRETCQKPRALESSRIQAKQGELVTSLRHEALDLSNSERAVLSASDGTHSLEEIGATSEALREDVKSIEGAFERLRELGFFRA